MPAGRFKKTISFAVQTEDLVKQLAPLHGAAEQGARLEASLAEAAKSISDTMPEMQAMVKTMVDMSLKVKDIQAAHTNIGTSLKLNSGLSEKIGKTVATEADLIKGKMGKAWNDVNKTIEQKNANHLLELDHIEDEQKVVQDVLKLWDALHKNIRDIGTATTEYVMGLLNVWKHLKAAYEAADNFNTVNYRVLGTQTAIVEEVYRTAAAYGLMSEEFSRPTSTWGRRTHQ
jgi:hypothetical protein